MKVKVQNLGIIKEADIDLGKRLLVFCGPNNTGKTYISYLLYALTNMSLAVQTKFSAEQLQQIVDGLILDYTFDIESLYQYREKQLRLIEQNLGVIFGMADDKVKSFFSTFSIQYVTTRDEYETRLVSESFSFNIKKKNISLKITKLSDSSIVRIENVSEVDIPVEELLPVLQYQLMGYIYKYLSLYPISSSEIFPVERNSIYTFNKELSLRRNIVLDQIQELGTGSKIDPVEIMNRRVTRYPMAIRDGLAVADDLVNIQSSKSKYADLADEIEQKLLNGQVLLSKDGEVQFASNKAKSKKIPIHLSASIVKTLSSLTFYLRYRAQDNDLVIIDEPELNLHPDCQILLVRVFGMMLNRGFRMLISTHSDYVIREINNLIMLSSLKETQIDKATKLGYSQEEAIKKEDVAAYLFTPKSRGKVAVQPIVVTDSGFEVQTIDDAIRGLNDASEELYYTMRSERLV